MVISDFKIGQIVQCDYWYKDYDGTELSTIKGKVTNVLECYNRVYIEVIDTILGYCNRKYISVNIDKSDISIIN